MKENHPIYKILSNKAKDIMETNTMRKIGNKAKPPRN